MNKIAKIIRFAKRFKKVAQFDDRKYESQKEWEKYVEEQKKEEEEYELTHQEALRSLRDDERDKDLGSEVESIDQLVKEDGSYASPPKPHTKEDQAKYEEWEKNPSFTSLTEDEEKELESYYDDEESYYDDEDEDENDEDKLRLSQNSKDPEILSRLSKDDDPKIRENVAWNMATPDEILNELQFDDDLDVRHGAEKTLEFKEDFVHNDDIRPITQIKVNEKNPWPDQ